MTTTDLFTGTMVRLKAESPELMAKALSRWGQDSEYFRLLDSEPPRLYSEKKFKEWLEKDLEKDNPLDMFYSIHTREDDPAGSCLIGFIGFFDLHWNHGDTLVAIAVGERQYWDKGYGTDAMRVMLRYAFHELNLRRVTLIVFEYNTRAIRSYEKAGFVREGRVRSAMLRDGRRWDLIYMGILREEWEQNEYYNE